MYVILSPFVDGRIGLATRACVRVLPQCAHRDPPPTAQSRTCRVVRAYRQRDAQLRAVHAVCGAAPNIRPRDDPSPAGRVEARLQTWSIAEIARRSVVHRNLGDVGRYTDHM